MIGVKTRCRGRRLSSAELYREASLPAGGDTRRGPRDDLNWSFLGLSIALGTALGTSAGMNTCVALDWWHENLGK